MKETKIHEARRQLGVCMAHYFLAALCSSCPQSRKLGEEHNLTWSDYLQLQSSNKKKRNTLFKGEAL